MIKSFMCWLNDPKDAEGQYNLGARYATGLGVKQNNQKAVQWYRKAAEQGHAKAQCVLGLRYVKGDGVSQDYQKAVYGFIRLLNKEMKMRSTI